MLSMIDLTLPNQTLSARWYDGQKYRISYLTFTEIAIAVIEANAFQSFAFDFLTNLIIANTIHIVEYNVGMFNGIARLALLDIEESTASQNDFPKNLLQPLSRYLQRFVYEGYVGNGSVLNNLFGSRKLPRLLGFGIICHGNSSLSYIAAANFSALSVIQYVALSHCRIESIELGAFESQVLW